MFSALTGFVMISLAPRYWVFRVRWESQHVFSLSLSLSILKATSLAPILYGASASGLAVIWGSTSVPHLQPAGLFVIQSVHKLNIFSIG